MSLWQFENVYSFDEIDCWVDSSVVFAWINDISKVYKQYFQSCLINIRNLLKPETWKLIPFKPNPSDVISWWIKVKYFISSKLWLNGPDSLTLPANLWPKLNSADQFIYDISSAERVSKDVSDDKSSTRLTSVACNVNVSVNNPVLLM